jgi:hypothetical protein
MWVNMLYVIGLVKCRLQTHRGLGALMYRFEAEEGEGVIVGVREGKYYTG